MKQISLLIFGLIIGGGIKAQPWLNASNRNNFYEIQNAFYQHWESKKQQQEEERADRLKSYAERPAGQKHVTRKEAVEPEKRRPGYKQFKRWEYMMEPRVYPTGEFPDPTIKYTEWVKMKQNRAAQRGSASSSAAAWTLIGPKLTVPDGGGAGRINCVEVDPNDPDILWAGAPAGGLWKSTDGGNTWSTNTDDLPVLGVTDIIIDPSNTNIMYIATGDGDANDTYSIGVLKSIDGGATWDTTDLSYKIKSGYTIRKLLINPLNPKVLFAACEDSIYKTTNSGATWVGMRYGNFKDIEMNPADTSLLYACTSNSFYRSTNGGLTWTMLSGNGWPSSGSIERATIAVTADNDNVVYALFSSNFDSGFLGLYKSTDKGLTWTEQSNTPNVMGWDVSGGDVGGQGWYTLSLAVSPTDEDMVIAGGVNMWRSVDGGVNWGLVSHWYGGGGAPYVHADIHSIDFAPNSGSVVYSGNDGGVFKSSNAGLSWIDKSHGLEILQLYRMSVSQMDEEVIIAGAQDNGTNLYDFGYWSEVLGGDGMECIIDPTTSDIMYGSLYNGEISRSYNRGGSWIEVSPTSNGAWVTPFIMNPVATDILYAGYKDIYKTNDNGNNWTKITTNLTGGALFLNMTLCATAPDNIYAATSGKLFKSSNAGTTWSSITAGLPINKAMISGIAVKDNDPSTIWVSFSGYNDTIKIYKTVNGGTTWKNETFIGLPNVPANCVTYDPVADGVYIGTDIGVFYKPSTGTSWIDFNDGLPNVIVNELEIQINSGKLRAATYGRGIWETPQYVNSVEEVKKDLVVNIYPNPFTGKVYVLTDGNADELQIQVYDITGRLITPNITVMNSKAELDFSHQPSGVYFIKTTQEETTKTSKVVLSR